MGFPGWETEKRAAPSPPPTSFVWMFQPRGLLGGKSKIQVQVEDISNQDARKSEPALIIAESLVNNIIKETKIASWNSTCVELI